MAIVIEIESTQLVTKRGTSTRTQKPYQIREQQALMFKDGSRYPDKIKITIGDGLSAYPVGKYTLHDDSFAVSRFGAVECRPVLVAIAASKPVAA